MWISRQFGDGHYLGLNLYNPQLIKIHYLLHLLDFRRRLSF